MLINYEDYLNITYLIFQIETNTLEISSSSFAESQQRQRKIIRRKLLYNKLSEDDFLEYCENIWRLWNENMIRSLFSFDLKNIYSFQNATEI